MRGKSARIIKRIQIGLYIFLFSSISTVNAQDNRPKIKEFVDQQIIVKDSWAGQSFTLKKENREYFIQRDIFGSGVPIILSIKYKVVFNSKYQIEFSEIIDPMDKSASEINCEHFILGVGNDGLELYLNRLMLTIRQPINHCPT